jgi:hypothetical protein
MGGGGGGGGLPPNFRPGDWMCNCGVYTLFILMSNLHEESHNSLVCMWCMHEKRCISVVRVLKEYREIFVRVLQESYESTGPNHRLHEQFL